MRLLSSLQGTRQVTFFEKVLLLVGIAAAVVGFYLIKVAYNPAEGITWLMLLSIFSWLTLLLLFVVSSVSTDVKEELSQMIKEQTQETRLLKELTHEMLEELRMTRAMTGKKK